MSKIIPFRAGPEDVDNVADIRDSVLRHSGGAVALNVSAVIRFALSFTADCARAQMAVEEKEEACQGK